MYPSIHVSKIFMISKYPLIQLSQKKSVSKISKYLDIRKKWYPLIPTCNTFFTHFICRNRRSDEEQTRKDYEEWIKSQGHSGHGAQKINMKQKFKNMWVEWRYGFKYYDFPWEIKSKHNVILEYFSIKK